MAQDCHWGVKPVPSGLLPPHPSLQVTLDCPGNDEIPRVDKLVEKILHCSCQACGKEPSHEGALFNVYLNTEENMPAEGPSPHHYAHHQQEVEEPPASSHHHHEEEGDE